MRSIELRALPAQPQTLQVVPRELESSLVGIENDAAGIDPGSHLEPLRRHGSQRQRNEEQDEREVSRRPPLAHTVESSSRKVESERCRACSRFQEACFGPLRPGFKMSEASLVPGPEGTLDALRAHPILTGAVRDRTRIFYRDLPTIPPADRTGPGVRAIQSVPTWREASDLVRELGRLRHVPAVPILVRLRERCPVVPVRQAAGHALFQIGTPEAHAALQGALEEADHLATFLAIKSIVASDPASAFGRLQSYLSAEALVDDARRAVAYEVLWFFGPATYSREGPGWNLPEIPVLLREDSRWSEVAIRLRRHPKVGPHARHLLESLERDEVEAALRRWPDPPRPPTPSYIGRRDFLARYERGDRVAVWRELLAIGPLPDDGLRLEVAAVARSTMRRVRTNVELVTARLRESGYPFDPSMPPWSPPASDVEDDVRRIEEAAGGLVPASLRAFWTIVGEVHWKHAEGQEIDDPRWGRDLKLAEADPLYVLSAANACSSVDEWQDRLQEHHAEVVGLLKLDLAPDYLHKANISGGAPYTITVPSDTADAMFENEEHELPFVDYLRLCFEWGGFPRLQRASLPDESRRVLEGLRRDLLHF